VIVLIFNKSYNLKMDNLIEIKNLEKIYKAEKSFLSFKKEDNYVLKNVNLNIKKGEIVSLVGESGCGKSTLANCILKLIEPDSGEILFEGENILKFNKKQTFEYRKKIQMIFQNPYSSLNPKMKIKETLEEPLIIHKIKSKKERMDKIFEIIDLTGISQDDLNKYPHEFSGGQRQRIAIARALILKPEFIVADEPVSALDVSICASIINMLLDLREKLNLTILFISHDLNLVRYLSDRIAVMNKGQIVEYKETTDLFQNPEDEYTKYLLSSIRTIKI
jgi:ABC-type oligopeptide transport system ATPase subunit